MVSISDDDARNEAGALAELTLPKTRVLYEPFIFHSAGTRTGETATPTECSNNTGNGARGGRASPQAVGKGESCILDVRVTDTDAKSYRGSTSAKVLEKAAHNKKAQV